MKKLIFVSLILSFGVLLITKGLYVEWGELMIVVFASCFIPILIRLRYRKREDVPHSFLALLAFGLFWAFSLFDLIGDHFLYYLPAEGVFYDGRPLTLVEKVNEFKMIYWWLAGFLLWFRYLCHLLYPNSREQCN